MTLLKYSIIERLMETNDEKLLKEVAGLVRPKPIPYMENEPKPMTVEELEEKIERSRMDAAEGKVHTSEELKEHFRKK